jgi:uncharacterized protein YndB with AHSA1/START domain
MRWEAAKELLAPRADVWALLAEPYHLADWWPDISGVRPDRRGLVPGARWQVIVSYHHPFAPRSRTESVVVVKHVEPPDHVVWHLIAQRLDVGVRLTTIAPDRTLATISAEGPWRPELLGRRRTFPRVAVNRLYALCQTAATL